MTTSVKTFQTPAKPNTSLHEKIPVRKVPSGIPTKFATVIPEHMMATANVEFFPSERRSATMLDTPK